MTTIKVQHGDITRLAVDAIVNAANTSLRGGGGVDGVIHRAAGGELLEACKELKGCKTGEAKITKGYKLPAAYVIHAVGPMWRDGNRNEPELLRSAYLFSLKLAVEHNIKTIAFPNISTGVFDFPKDLAAEIAISTIRDFCDENPDKLTEIVFVCFEEDNFLIYQSLLS